MSISYYSNCIFFPLQMIRFKVDMSQFPIISRINEELSEHPAFKAAHWNNQPDCPADLKT